jgi:hypothetical protein
MAFSLDPHVWLINLLVRLDGPGAVRFIVQPLMAGALGIRDGLRDAREGHRPFLSGVLHDVSRRKESIREAVTTVGKPLVLSICIDALVSYFVLGAVYPGSTLFVATLLILVPYVVAREVTVHVVTHRHRSAMAPSVDRA